MAHSYRLLWWIILFLIKEIENCFGIAVTGRGFAEAATAAKLCSKTADSGEKSSLIPPTLKRFHMAGKTIQGQALREKNSHISLAIGV